MNKQCNAFSAVRKTSLRSHFFCSRVKCLLPNSTNVHFTSLVQIKKSDLEKHYHRIQVSEIYLTYHQNVVQVLHLPPIILNLFMYAFVDLYLAFCRLHQTENPLFQLLPCRYQFQKFYVHISTGDPKCTHDNLYSIFVPCF